MTEPDSTSTDIRPTPAAHLARGRLVLVMALLLILGSAVCDVPLVHAQGGISVPDDSPGATASPASPRTGPAGDLQLGTPITPRQTPRTTAKSSKTNSKNSSTTGWTTTAVSLGVVFVLIAGVAYFARRSIPGLNRGLPKSVLEVLGRRALEPRSSLHLVRCGRRILILGSSPAGLTTLSTIDDPVEIDYLAGLCRGDDDRNPLSDFRNLFLKQWGDPTEPDKMPETKSPPTADHPTTGSESGSEMPFGDPAARHPDSNLSQDDQARQWLKERLKGVRNDRSGRAPEVRYSAESGQEERYVS